MPLAVLVVVSLLLVAFAQVLGGPPWGGLCLIALVAQTWTDRRTSNLVLIASSLFWLVLSQVTGRRDLFFPYAMSLASLVFLQLADRNFWAGVVGGVVALGAFFLVRIQQQASTRVLVVEFIVATAILEFVMVAHAWRPRRLSWRIAIDLAASLLAWCSLAL